MSEGRMDISMRSVFIAVFYRLIPFQARIFLQNTPEAKLPRRDFS